MKNKPAEEISTLTFPQLIEHLIACGIEYAILNDEDAPPDKRFAAKIYGRNARSSDPLTALLQALALGMRREEFHTAKRLRSIAAFNERKEKLQALVPGYEAHAPTLVDNDVCEVCGDVHDEGSQVPAPVSILRDAMNALGFKTIIERVATEPTAKVEKKAKKKREN